MKTLTDDMDLNNRVTRLESAMESLTNVVSRMVSSIDRIETSISGIGKTDLKTILWMIGIVVPTLTFLQYLFATPLELKIGSVASQVAAIEQDFKFHKDESFHPGGREKISSLEGDVKMLDRVYDEKFASIEQRLNRMDGLGVNNCPTSILKK